VAQRVGRDIALLFHDRGTRRECSAARPGCSLPLGKTWYPFYGRLLHHQYNVIIDKTTELLLQHVSTLSCSGYFIGHKNAKSKIYKYKVSCINLME